MKTFSLSKREVFYLHPVNATYEALNTAINIYFINIVFKRLGLAPDTKARFDLEKGELYIDEDKDEKTVAAPVTAPVVPVEPPAGNGKPPVAEPKPVN